MSDKPVDVRPLSETEQQQAQILKAVARFASEMTALGVTCTWSQLYNATRPTTIIALEIDPALFKVFVKDDRP